MARILVLNDDQAMLDVYVAALKELGHEPVTRKIVESGAETVRDFAAEALVVDLMRPDEDDYGLRIIEQIRADPELRGFPIVLCTGAGKDLVPMLRTLESLGVPVLRKPFPIAELRATLERVMREAAPAA